MYKQGYRALAIELVPEAAEQLRERLETPFAAPTTLPGGPVIWVGARLATALL